MAKKLTEEQKAENKRIASEKRALAKKEREEKAEAEKIQRMKDQPRVSRIEIMIEWRKSGTWGSNPHLQAKVFGVDKYIGTFHYTCSGCGYDKESTVIADVFNNFLRYKLFLVQPDVKKWGGNGLPYGVHLGDDWCKIPYYDGAIGTDCYISFKREDYESEGIAGFIGGTFKKVASGKTSDAFEYVDDGTIM